LVDFNDIYGKGKEERKEGAKRTRRGRGGAKKTETAEATKDEAPKSQTTTTAEE